YYNSPVTNLNELLTVNYSFKITERTGFADTTAPYVVIKTANLVAVQMIPDGGNYVMGTDHMKTIDDTTLFHTPGKPTCTQAIPCTFGAIKTEHGSEAVTEVSLALGAWGNSANAIKASMGISTINGEQAVHKSLVVSPGETSSLRIVTDFPKMMKPNVYDFTTTVTPVEE
ncbi:hypothetical protein LCGC14_1905180, partial [marine sediment metagenome]